MFFDDPQIVVKVVIGEDRFLGINHSNHVFVIVDGTDEEWSQLHGLRDIAHLIQDLHDDGNIGTPSQ